MMRRKSYKKFFSKLLASITFIFSMIMFFNVELIGSAQEGISWLFNPHYEDFDEARRDVIGSLRILSDESMEAEGVAVSRIVSGIERIELTADQGVWGAAYFLAKFFRDGVPGKMSSAPNICREWMGRSRRSGFIPASIDGC